MPAETERDSIVATIFGSPIAIGLELIVVAATAFQVAGKYASSTVLLVSCLRGLASVCVGRIIVGLKKQDVEQSQSATRLVDADIRSAYRKYGRQLGKPVNPVKKQENRCGLYQAWHEHATVLAVPLIETVFFQVFNTGNHEWKKADDAEWAGLKWRDEDYRRRMFPNCRAPLQGGWAGVGQSMHENPRQWRGVGCLVSHLYLDASKLRLQEFENGYILSGFRLSHDASVGIAFVLINGEPWIKENTDETILACRSCNLPTLPGEPSVP